MAIRRNSGCLTTLFVWGTMVGLGAYIGGEPRIKNFVDNKAIPYFTQTIVPEAKKFISEAKSKSGVEEKANQGSSGFLDNLGFSKMTTNDPMHHLDGTKVEPWQYNGNSWPSEWPITNPDGSFNQDYLRWYSKQGRR